MHRAVRLIAAAMALTALLAGVTYAATRPVPENLPQVVLQNMTETQLPGDAQELEEALQASAPVQYKLLVIESTEEEDKTDYLDRVAAQWGVPGANTLYLIIYTRDNYDIRFYMGANFRTNGVTVEEMLGLVRTHYFTKSQKGDVAGGLVDLIGAVNQRMGTGTTPVPVASQAPYSVPDPFGDGTRQSAAGQLQIAQGLLTHYFEGLKAESVRDENRLLDYRWAENQIHVLEGSRERILYEIRFDVQPAAGEKSTWANGAAGVGADGWITGLGRFMTVVKEGDRWRMEGLAVDR